MSPRPLETLLEKLCAGEAESAEQVFREYEPFLRMVVRRMLPGNLRSKFDSIDVVQSVWVDLVAGFRASKWRFDSAEELRSFLVKVTRNRFLDHQRKLKKVTAAETSLEGAGLDPVSGRDRPRPGQEEPAEELWQRILAHTPAQHQQLLQLKLQGYNFDEIAERTGYHASSIRRIFYDLARRFGREGQATKHSDREEP